MAYGYRKAKPRTKFGEWLDQWMQMLNMSGLEVADKLHCTESIISYHRSGKKRPTFSDIVAYCWVFGCNEDPETIWKMVDILIKEN